MGSKLVSLKPVRGKVFETKSSVRREAQIWSDGLGIQEAAVLLRPHFIKLLRPAGAKASELARRGAAALGHVEQL